MNNIKSPFKYLCVSLGNLPTAYLESMSYYECITFLVNFLEKQVIPVINNNSSSIQELQNLYLELKEYVDNYFENLDVQQEINNKLDEMADSGELTDIIAQYLGLAGVLAYDTVADMKEAENLANGSICKTLGYNNIQDSGGCLYKVRTVTNEDVIDEGKLIALSDNNLVAEMIENHFINPIMFGCTGDNITDDSINFLKCLLAYNDVVIDLLNKEYNLETLNSFTFNKNTTLKNGIINIDNIIMRNEDGLLNLENVTINTNSLTDYENNQQYTIFSESGDTGSLKVKNCKLISDKTLDNNNITCLIYLKDYVDCEITDSIIENKNGNTTAGGCVWLSAKTLTRNNAIIRNNIIKNNCIDENIAIYDVTSGKYTEISNNYIESLYPSNYANTMYNNVSDLNVIKNNTFKGCSIELSIHSLTNVNPYIIEVNNNNIIHDNTNQTDNDKSGLYVPSGIIANIDNNNFTCINSGVSTYTVIPFNVPDKSISGWNIKYDSNTEYNKTGTALKRINSNYDEVYSIYGNLENCNINTTTGRMTSAIQGYNCNFNISNGVNGYATGDIIFKNCSGGIFENQTSASSLIIENSSVDYCYGSLTTYVNNQTRLDSACTTGHIYFSSMNDTALSNLTHS